MEPKELEVQKEIARLLKELLAVNKQIEINTR